ncbi:MAG TPA: hypothetical protein VF283_20675 [Bryobacteraceae bacterium]
MLYARQGHSLNTTTPLLDQTEILKRPIDHPISQLRETVLDLFNCDPKREQARILDFYPVVKQRDRISAPVWA